MSNNNLDIIETAACIRERESRNVWVPPTLRAKTETMFLHIQAVSHFSNAFDDDFADHIKKVMLRHLGS